MLIGIEVITVIVDSDCSDQISYSEENPKIILLVTSEEQKTTLLHPIRKPILRVLSTGKSDFETITTTENTILEDGTGLTHLVEIKKPIRRYWMTIQEIVIELQKKHPALEITSQKCYYHIEQLINLGLVVQNPPSDFDEKGTKIRVRGKQFRTVARFFIISNQWVSASNFDALLSCLNNVWGVVPSEDDRVQLIDLISQQEQALFDTFEKLSVHTNDFDIDSVSLSLLLERLAHVYLSDDEQFIEGYRKMKQALTRSGAKFLATEDPAVVEKGDTK